MQISVIDIDDDAAVAAVHSVMAAADEHDLVDPPTIGLQEWQTSLRKPAAPFDRVLVLATDDGVPVGMASAALPTTDNPTLAEATLSVHPDHRRRGIGTAVFGELRRALQARGRTSVIAEVAAGPDGTTDIGRSFAERHGLTVRNVETRRGVALPIDPTYLTALIDETRPASADYEFLTFEGAVPDEYAADFVDIIVQLDADAPTGGLEFELSKRDVTWLRTAEANLAEQGRRPFRCIAVAADGSVAAMTELVVPTPVNDPRHIYQWTTLVRGEHRGHRLGLAVKARNHLFLQETLPDERRSAQTWNGNENPWMIEINERIGFRKIDQWLEMQGDL